MHWRFAAKWNLLTFDEFIAKDGPEQSRLVAMYEDALLIEAIANLDAEKEAKRKAKRGTNRRRM